MASPMMAKTTTAVSAKISRTWPFWVRCQGFLGDWRLGMAMSPPAEMLSPCTNYPSERRTSDLAR